MQFSPFLTFLKVYQGFFIEIDTRIMLIISTKQDILINSLNFDEKYLICFKKFNKKGSNCINFSIIETKLSLKKPEGLT